MTAIPKMTPAQREALLAASRHDRVYLSNRNGETFVARSSAGVLRRLGLVERAGDSLHPYLNDWVFITLKGREVVEAMEAADV